MDGAEHDVLAFMGFPAAHRAKISSTNPLERVNGEIKRRSDVVGISWKREAFAAGPNEAAVRRLGGALLPSPARPSLTDRCYTTHWDTTPVSVEKQQHHSEKITIVADPITLGRCHVWRVLSKCLDVSFQNLAARETVGWEHSIQRL